MTFTSSRFDTPPAKAQGSVVRGKCSACGKAVQHKDQWRCPWVGCMIWFHDADWTPPKKRNEKERQV